MSAISLLIGAGAHRVTAGLVEGAADAELGFARWALLGTPFGLDRGGRCAPVSLHSRGLSAPCGRLQTAERPRGTALVATVVALWCTEPLHGIGAGLVPVAAALNVIPPLIGSIAARDSIAGIDWRPLLLLAATLQLDCALTGSGAAVWLVDGAFDALRAPLAAAPLAAVALVAAISLAAHLAITSRTARSSARRSQPPEECRLGAAGRAHAALSRLREGRYPEYSAGCSTLLVPSL